MGHGHSQTPTRDELVRLISNKPIPAMVRQVGWAGVLIGLGLFVYGAATGEQRAWTALHMNWLFFTIIASAGVVFAAVQRIVTARWSRPVVRQIEGFVAFMPIAFIILLVMIFGAGDKVYTWWNLVGTPDLIDEKNIYFNHTFFYLRSILIFGGLTLLSLWYVYTSVRLDVGVTPEEGSKWAAGIRAKMRAGFGDERRELHSTHSLQGVLAVILALVFGMGWPVLAWDHSMSLMYYFFSTMYGWQVFMGGWLAMLMTWAMLSRWWRNHLGAQHLITESHFHDIGKLAFAFTAFCSLVGIWLARYTEIYPSVFLQTVEAAPLGIWEIGIGFGMLGAFILSYAAFMDAFPKMRVFLMTSPYRDEVQVPCDPKTMEPLPAHE